MLRRGERVGTACKPWRAPARQLLARITKRMACWRLCACWMVAACVANLLACTCAHERCRRVERWLEEQDPDAKARVREALDRLPGGAPANPVPPFHLYSHRCVRLLFSMHGRGGKAAVRSTSQSTRVCTPCCPYCCSPACQAVNGGTYCKGAGLGHGDVNESVWASLGHKGKTTKVRCAGSGRPVGPTGSLYTQHSCRQGRET
jgi:hypothetical protein